jgi:ABC-type Fe3+ transport system permease subunit
LKITLNNLRSISIWQIAIILITLLFALPLFTVFSFIFEPAGEVWQHLLDTVLKDYIINSVLLLLGVTVGSLLIGVSTAWLTSLCDFPGRRLFEWALLLPLAMPAYIIAYTYTGLFDFAGPVQTILREWFNWGYRDYWFPQIRSLGGAILMFSLRDTGITLLVYPPGHDTLPVRIFTLMANGSPELIAALCIIIITVTLIPASILWMIANPIKTSKRSQFG